MSAAPTLRANEVAELYGVCPDTLYRAVQAGDFPVMPRRIGRALRWITAEVHADLGLDAQRPGRHSPVATEPSSAVPDFERHPHDARPVNP